MTAAEVSIVELIYKRHAGDGWFVFSELPSRPDYSAARRADYAALGLWRSTGYEFHLYETKVTRQDVLREMKDPSKVDGVGKYAHYWWLVINDLKIIKDVLIPDAWGILVPTTRGGSRFLTVHRKAPKQKPKPFDAAFCVAIIRNMARNWVKPEAMREVQESLDQLRRDKRQDDVDEEQVDYKVKYERLEASVKKFEETSGVSIVRNDAWDWRAGEIGRCVRLALEIHGHHGDKALRDDIGKLIKTADEHQRLAAHAATLATSLRSLMPVGQDVEHAPQCMRRSWGPSQRCECGAVMSEVELKISTHAGAEVHRRLAEYNAAQEVPAPLVANGNDDRGSGDDRGGAGQDVEDAGALVRDQRPEVPHG